MKRRKLTNAEFAKLWLQQEGRCACGCGERLVMGEVDREHTVALSMGGTDTLDNITLYLRAHHKAKTAQDLAMLAKAKRRALFQATGKSHQHKVRPIPARPFCKQFRRRMDGTTERVSG